MLHCRCAITRLMVFVAITVAVAACSSSANPTTQSAVAVTPPTTVTLPPTSAPTTTVPATTIPPTTIPPTTTIPLVTQGAVMIVANASNVTGAAAQLTAELQALGFTAVAPTNATAWDAALDTTKIYATAEATPVAEALASVLGGVPIMAMPTPAPIDGATAGLNGATVLIMLGKDLAGKALPERAG